MKYCNKCKRIYNDEELSCESCKGKSKLLSIEDNNTPVNLLTAEGFELKRIQSALEDAGIPNDAALCEHNYSVNAVTGYDCSKYNLLEPFEPMSRAKRTTVRVVTALLFLGLVALAVFGTDFIMKLIKGLF